MDQARIAFYLLALGAGLMAGLGDTCLFQWTKSDGKVTWLLGGLVSWNISLAIFIAVLRRGVLAQSVIIYIVANCVVALGISYFALHETLSRQQWCGIAVALVGIIIMELSK